MDDAALVFTKFFYKAILTPKTVCDAFKEANAKIKSMEEILVALDVPDPWTAPGSDPWAGLEVPPPPEPDQRSPFDDLNAMVGRAKGANSASGQF